MRKLWWMVLVALPVSFLGAALIAQDKKDEPKKEEPKKEEPKKEEPKKEEPKKEEPKKEEPKTTVTQFTWSFKVNEPFWQKVVTSSEQFLKVSNQSVTQKSEQTFTFKWTPIKQDGDKWILEQQITALVMNIDIAGNPVSFDSKDKNATGALAEFFKELSEAKFTITLNKAMKVEKIDGRTEFIRKMAAKNAQMEGLLNKVLNEDAMKQMTDPSFGFVPTETKKVGESWIATSKLNLGPIGTYNNSYKYTYKASDKGVDTITVEPTITYSAPAEDKDNILPFKIKSANLKSDKSDQGEITFAEGRVKKSRISVKTSGTLNIEIGSNTPAVVELVEQKQTTIVETFPTDPDAAKSGK